jgi:hypothetical protein
MEPLYYSRGRLVSAATFFLVVGGFFVWMWMDPSWVRPSSRWGWLLGSDFGRYIFIPSCAGVCLAVSGLTASLGLGNGKALQSTGTHLIVSTLLGRKQIALSELRSFGIERSGGYPHLVLEGDGIGVLGGSTLRIALGTVQDGESRIPSLLDTLAALRADALRPRLDRARAAPGAAVPALPQRAAFGRKGS